MKKAIINSLNMFQYSPVFVDKQILLCSWLEVKFLVQVFPFLFVICVWTKYEKDNCAATASLSYTEDEGTRVVQGGGTCLPNYAIFHSRRHQFTRSFSLEYQISGDFITQYPSYLFVTYSVCYIIHIIFLRVSSQVLPCSHDVERP